MQNIKRWISLVLVVCLLAMLPAAALAEDTETGTGLPVEGEIVTSPSPSASAAEESETATSPSPSASAAVESETVTSPSPSASAAAAESETVTSPSPSIEASVSPSPSAETSPAPVETATKTIASFEALTPELFAPQGTLETGLGLPVSLDVQFTGGAAGEVAVAWQCAAGYDPSAEAGGQFAFAAVLPEGYALLEGVSLPQILVTLTPPLANAMLMAETRDTDWTLSEDGKLTVTGYVMSSTIDSFESDVKSIEVIGTGRFTLVDGMSFSGDIYALEQDSFFNNGTITGGNIVGKMINAGKITGGIISGDVVNSGEIIDGTFPGAVSNRSSITGGDFRGAIVVNESGSTITGGDFTSATVKNIGDATVTGGTFSNVAFDSTSGELTITGNVDLDEEDALAPLTIRQAQIKSVVVAENGTFDAGSTSFFGPVTNNGTITGGTITGPVTNSGEITGGTFNGEAVNEGTIRGGVFYGTVKNQAPYSLIQGYGETTPTLNGEIVNELDFGSGTPRILQPCNFGPNASVTVNNGVIEVKVIVDEVEKTVNYGADILKALGPSPTGLWYRENEDDTRSLVKEGETFASLQGETYTSSPLLPKPEIEIDYINETFSVTLAEEDVPEGVDVTDIYVNFRQLGQSEFLYAGMASFPIVLSLSDFDRYWGLKLPSDKEITLEAYYSFAVTDANGNETVVAYGETVEWVIPARPDINVDTVYPGYNEMTVTLDAEPYEVYLESVDGSTVIYDADDGAVDGCIHGLTEGTEYTVYFRVLPTEDSFGSFPYSLAATHTTLTRTHLSVNAAAGAWEWQQGFSLNAEDCFAVQVTLQGEKEMPEKGKFILTATKDGREVPFPLTEPGAYTITASLSADVADDYVLDNTSFTVVIGERWHEIDSRDITVRPIPAQTYTGGPIYPAVSVWHGATQLVMGEDYTVSYQNNVKVGVATIVITGMGDYAGTRLAFFDIVPPRAKDEEKPSGGSGGSTGNGGETAETTGEAQQNRLVVDENGAAMPYTYSTVEVLDEETGAVTARKLAIAAGPVRDETGAIVYDADGQALYAARSLLLSRELLDAIAFRGYTHIRFTVKDAALEWPLSSMPGDNYIVRLAPLEGNEWNGREMAAIEGRPSSRRATARRSWNG